MEEKRRRKKVEDERERRKNCANNSLVCNCTMWNNYFFLVSSSRVALLILSSLFAFLNVVNTEMMNINVSRFLFYKFKQAPGVDAFLNYFHRSFQIHAMKVDLDFFFIHMALVFFLIQI